MFINEHINKKAHSIKTYNFLYFIISLIRAQQLVCTQLRGKISVLHTTYIIISTIIYIPMHLYIYIYIYVCVCVCVGVCV